MRQSQIAILGAPLDLGAGRRGVDMGPSALRLAGLNAKLESLGYEVEDLGNVSVAQPESTPTGPRNAKYLEQIATSNLDGRDFGRRKSDEVRKHASDDGGMADDKKIILLSLKLDKSRFQADCKWCINASTSILIR